MKKKPSRKYRFVWKKGDLSIELGKRQKALEVIVKMMALLEKR